MPTDDRDPELSDADRRAIADIRRQLDAEFGALEPTTPLVDEPQRVDQTAAPRRRVEPAPPRPIARPAARALERQQIAERALRTVGRRRRRPSLSVFLLGALVGGLAGGVAGGAATLWLLGVDTALDRRAAERMPPGDSPAAAPAPRADDRRALTAALDEWLAATRRGDIEAQMQFYPARVPVYYTWRDVPRAAVREEKKKVFGEATRLEIATDPPVLELTDGGRGAVTRFRKRYVIEGPTIRRRGEVIQELRWSRLSDGWRIVAERDAEVLAP